MSQHAFCVGHADDILQIRMGTDLLDPIKISRYRRPIFDRHLDRLWEQVHNCPMSFPRSI